MTKPNPIGDRIALFRRKAGFDKAADLADAIPNERITTSVIQNIESGRKADISVTQLLEIAFALEISPLFLLAPMNDRMARVDLPNVSEPISSMRADDFDRWISILSGASLPTLRTGKDWAWTASVSARLLRDLVEAMHEWDELGDRPSGDDAITLTNGGVVIFDETEHYERQLETILARVSGLLSRLGRLPAVDLSWLPDALTSEVRQYETALAAEFDRTLADERRVKNLQDAETLQPDSRDGDD
ncbi:helix-turn-helix transcriptional regulator [Microbacterium sp. NPDC078814]|uniref:helix-turn-helix domain-containing protein n=1 Tax=Microbacterium sp. NPDC078814 TaxID=3154767 RepID=UPI00344B3FEA